MAPPWRPATVAVHGGRLREPGAPVNPPISMSSTFRHGGDLVYGRDDNPTWRAFEHTLGSLEGGPALVFGSGMAAVSAVMETVAVGGVVVVAAGGYNGTRRWMADAVARGRLSARSVDATDVSAVLAACDGADLLWLESPTNPGLDIVDLRSLIAGCGIPVAVDNTLATPLLQRPLGLGARFAVHSVTKWLGGHSDLVMGAVACATDADLEAIRLRRSLDGAVAGSVEAWLALRGLRSLPARLGRAQATACELASRLEADPAVERVRYPGLPSHPGHAVAAAQMDGPGAMVSFDVRGGADAAEAVCAALELIVHSTSLGGVETQIERRGRYVGEEAVPPGLLRMSVGQEDVEDLWDDLSAALAAGTTRRLR